MTWLSFSFGYKNTWLCFKLKRGGLWWLFPIKSLGSGMMEPMFNPRRQKKISEFYISLVESMFQVKKSLGTGMLAINFNPSTLVWKPCRFLSSSQFTELVPWQPNIDSRKSHWKQESCINVIELGVRHVPAWATNRTWELQASHYAFRIKNRTGY